MEGEEEKEKGEEEEEVVAAATAAATGILKMRELLLYQTITPVCKQNKSGINTVWDLQDMRL